MEQPILPDLKEQTQLLDDLEQERQVDELLAGFVDKCSIYKDPDYFQYESQKSIYKRRQLGLTKFSFWKFLTIEARIEYSMNRLPFGKANMAFEDTNLKRVAKILILLWYLALIENLQAVFNPDKDSKITNSTNKANYGFSKKIFGDKMSVSVVDNDYLWEITVGDFLSSKDDIRDLLKRYLFEATNYCGKVCFITPEELDLIDQHC